MNNFSFFWQHFYSLIKSRFSWSDFWVSQIFCCVIASVLASIYLIIPDESFVQFPFTKYQLAFYVFVTESIFGLSALWSFFQPKFRIVSGAIPKSLMVPQDFITTELHLIMSRILGHLPLVMVYLTLVYWFLIGEFMPIKTFVGLSVSIFFASVLQVAFALISALFQVKGEAYARSMLMLTQKLGFLLGGMVLPISFYPQLLQTISWFLPFASLYHIPGSMTWVSSWAEILTLVLMQIFWCFLGLMLTKAVLQWVYSRVHQGVEGSV